MPYIYYYVLARLSRGLGSYTVDEVSPMKLYSGAYEQYGGPLIVIDIGTATTFDVVAKNGDFLGGVIAPGRLRE